jgi:hypothetical protein
MGGTNSPVQGDPCDMRQGICPSGYLCNNYVGNVLGNDVYLNPTNIYINGIQNYPGFCQTAGIQGSFCCTGICQIAPPPPCTGTNLACEGISGWGNGGICKPGYTLRVSKVGTGKVVQFGGAINCGTTCSANFPHPPPTATIYLTALAPVAGWGFIGWNASWINGGSGLNSDPEVTTYMSADQSVTANFIPTDYTIGASPNTGTAQQGIAADIYAWVTVSNLTPNTDGPIVVSAASNGGLSVGFNAGSGSFTDSYTCTYVYLNGECNAGMKVSTGQSSPAGTYEILISATISGAGHSPITLTTPFTVTINP